LAPLTGGLSSKLGHGAAIASGKLINCGQRHERPAATGSQ